MINDIPKPALSPNFTIDDIHKIREWNYERMKDATWEERVEDTRRGADAARQQIDAFRRERQGA
ncbi:hypothetical protein FACS1894139_09320 [Planctomycetales bacterium]|nr:hypothetical protein FACS1894107_07280 [Planctomycetales bacterium]GHT01879.1 hypothetical protein FACS1894108_15890 [Planctomycetales bacterium]GHT05464.1 hypothetical protein FACS1894139_09320 [Planctomycetales bacterium]